MTEIDPTRYARRAVLVDFTQTRTGHPVSVGDAIYLESVRIKTAVTGYLDEYGSFGYYLEMGQPPWAKGSTRPATLWIRCIDGENLIVVGTTVTIEGMEVLTAPFDEWKRYEAHGKQLVWVPVFLEEVVVTRKGSPDDVTEWAESGMLL